MSPINSSGASGSSSAENLSSGSNNQMSSVSRGDAFNTTSNSHSDRELQAAHVDGIIVESPQREHGEADDAEISRAAFQHQEQRQTEGLPHQNRKEYRSECPLVNQGHGVKRSGSHSWEGDSYKIFLHLSCMTHRYILQFLIFQC